MVQGNVSKMLVLTQCMYILQCAAGLNIFRTGVLTEQKQRRITKLIHTTHYWVGFYFAFNIFFCVSPSYKTVDSVDTSRAYTSYAYNPCYNIENIIVLQGLDRHAQFLIRNCLYFNLTQP